MQLLQLLSTVLPGREWRPTKRNVVVFKASDFLKYNQEVQTYLETYVEPGSGQKAANLELWLGGWKIKYIRHMSKKLYDGAAPRDVAVHRFHWDEAEFLREMWDKPLTGPLIDVKMEKHYMEFDDDGWYEIFADKRWGGGTWGGGNAQEEKACFQNFEMALIMFHEKNKLGHAWFRENWVMEPNEIYVATGLRRTMLNPLPPKNSNIVPSKWKDSKNDAKFIFLDGFNCNQTSYVRVDSKRLVDVIRFHFGKACAAYATTKAMGRTGPVHAGRWGSNVFANPLEAMYLVQLMAAHVTGTSLIINEEPAPENGWKKWEDALDKYKQIVSQHKSMKQVAKEIMPDLYKTTKRGSGLLRDNDIVGAMIKMTRKTLKEMLSTNLPSVLYKMHFDWWAFPWRAQAGDKPNSIAYSIKDEGMAQRLLGSHDYFTAHMQILERILDLKETHGIDLVVGHAAEQRVGKMHTCLHQFLSMAQTSLEVLYMPTKQLQRYKADVDRFDKHWRDKVQIQHIPNHLYLTFSLENNKDFSGEANERKNRLDFAAGCSNFPKLAVFLSEAYGKDLHTVCTQINPFIGNKKVVDAGWMLSQLVPLWTKG